MQAKPNKIIAGNWKMYKTKEEVHSFLDQFIPLCKDVCCQVYLAVPSLYIESCLASVRGDQIQIGAQNVSSEKEGAYTGEISAKMLKSVGAKFALVGHSERRILFQESNAIINQKIQRCLENDIQPVVCIGETQSERTAGQTFDVLEKQIRESLKGLTHEDLSKLVLAYEPVWAIGTGLTASPEDAEKAHTFCRQLISKIWGEESSQTLSILYGGSVKEDNASQLMKQSQVDGLLVGGASLKAQSFGKIIHFDKSY